MKFFVQREHNDKEVVQQSLVINVFAEKLKNVFQHSLSKNGKVHQRQIIDIFHEANFWDIFVNYMKKNSVFNFHPNPQSPQKHTHLHHRSL